MTLKEQLEILRGEPIQLKAPVEEIPCIETSDAEKLCKHPVVSVNMITYNHEPYIRQAIEGVMMQQTDFEFELVIGEDASKDKTREICFEYQKKYPDKIRVLWSEENVSHLGGNGRRVMARCRGEFIALCEGDDYWIDPLKLQKQVDAMRRYPNVGIVIGNYAHYDVCTGTFYSPQPKFPWPEGVTPSNKAFLWILYGANPNCTFETLVHTSTVMLRSVILQKAFLRYQDLFSFRFSLGDLQIWLGVTSLSDLYCYRHPFSIYRCNTGGLMSNMLSACRVRRDGMLTVFYFTKKVLGLNLLDVPSYLMDSWLFSTLRVLSIKGVTQDVNVGAILKQIKTIDIARLKRYQGVLKLFENKRFNTLIYDSSLPKKVELFFGRICSNPVTKLYMMHAPDEFRDAYAEWRVKRMTLHGWIRDFLLNLYRLVVQFHFYDLCLVCHTIGPRCNKEKMCNEQ